MTYQSKWPQAEHLEHQGEIQRAAALEACAAVERLARAANGNSGHVLPAPDVYALLGEIKVLLWHLSEVTEHLPRGLAASLQHPHLDVYDRDVEGAVRAPADQVQKASTHLADLTTALHTAAAETEAAQTALGGQGYNSKTPNN